MFLAQLSPTAAVNAKKSEEPFTALFKPVQTNALSVMATESDTTESLDLGDITKTFVESKQRRWL